MAGFRGRSVEHGGERPQHQHRDELEPQLLDRETEGPGLLGEPQEIHRHRPKEPREHPEAETLRDLLARGGSDPSAVQGTKANAIARWDSGRKTIIHAEAVAPSGPTCIGRSK